jgi:hypothetical protein
MNSMVKRGLSKNKFFLKKHRNTFTATVIRLVARVVLHAGPKNFNMKKKFGR